MRIILRNIFSNWLGYVTTMLVGFFLSPFVVHHLGNTGYGLWTLVLSLTGYFGLFDLGIRFSVGRFVARYVALDDRDGVNRTVSTAMAILAGCGTLALIATATLSLGFGVFKVEPQYAAAGRLALIVAGINLSFALPLSVFGAILLALERYDVMNAITVMSSLTRAALVVVTLSAGRGLVELALVSLTVALIEYTAAAFAAHRLYPALRIRLAHVRTDHCRELFGFSVYRFIWIVANQLIFYTDSVVIGIFAGAAAITPYAIAGTLLNYGRTVVALGTDPFYPTATRLDSQHDLAGLRDLQIRGTTVGLLLALPLCIGYVSLGRQFITLWMGPAHQASAIILTVLTIPQVTSMSQYISALILSGMARHKVLAWLALSEGIANLALSIVLIRLIGVIGVAWGTVIPHLLCTAIIVPLCVMRTLDLNWRTYFARAFARPLACSVPTAVLAWAFSRNVVHPTWPLFTAEATALCAVFFGLAYFLCLTPGEQSWIAARVSTLIRRREAVAHEA